MEKATRLAVEMVGLYGMSAQMGRRRLLATSNGDGYLGADGDGTRLEAVSGQTMQEFDGEVKRLLEAAEHKAAEVLNFHREALERMAEALEVEETLEGSVLESFLAPARPEVNLLGGGPLATHTPAKAKAARKAKRPSGA